MFAQPVMASTSTRPSPRASSICPRANTPRLARSSCPEEIAARARLSGRRPLRELSSIEDPDLPRRGRQRRDAYGAADLDADYVRLGHECLVGLGSEVGIVLETEPERRETKPRGEGQRRSRRRRARHRRPRSRCRFPRRLRPPSPCPSKLDAESRRHTRAPSRRAEDQTSDEPRPRDARPHVPPSPLPPSVPVLAPASSCRRIDDGNGEHVHRLARVVGAGSLRRRLRRRVRRIAEEEERVVRGRAVVVGRKLARRRELLHGGQRLVEREGRRLTMRKPRGTVDRCVGWIGRA